ncbi:MAG: hypothetical protein ACRDUV_04990 [Pseudonocardiaceae bacterium]
MTDAPAAPPYPLVTRTIRRPGRSCVARYGIEEWTGLFTGIDKLVEDGEILLRHGRRAEVAAGETEGAHLVVDDCGSLGRSIADTFVLHQHDPALLAG